MPLISWFLSFTKAALGFLFHQHYLPGVQCPFIVLMIYIPCCVVHLCFCLCLSLWFCFPSEVFGPESFSEQYINDLSIHCAGMYFQTRKVTVTRFYVCLHVLFCFVGLVLEVRAVDSVKLNKPQNTHHAVDS